MNSSLSRLDAVEAQRQDLLAEVSLAHRQDTTTTIKGATSMWAMVNASYGIAMGQRPISTEHSIPGHTETSIHSAQRYPPQPAATNARCVRHVLRAIAAAFTNPGRLRILTSAKNR